MARVGPPRTPLGPVGCPVAPHTDAGRRGEIVPGRHPRTYHGHRAGGGCGVSRTYAGTGARPSLPPAFSVRFNHPGLSPPTNPSPAPLRALAVCSAHAHPPLARSLPGVVVLTRKILLRRPPLSPPVTFSGNARHGGAGLAARSVDQSLSNQKAHLWKLLAALASDPSPLPAPPLP